MSDVDELRVQRLRDQIAEIQSQMQEIGDADIATLNETIFVGAFLPFFAGDDKLPYPVTFATWINVAGSAYKSVHVIDDKRKVLFTVPPLLDRSAIRPVSDDAVPIAHMVQSAEQYARVSPRQGEQYLSAELTRRAIVMSVPANVLANIEVWNNIFTRYGRPPVMAIDQPSTPRLAGTSGPKDEPDYDFEPL